MIENIVSVVLGSALTSAFFILIFRGEKPPEINRHADSYRLSCMRGDDWRNMSGDKLARIVAILEEK